MAPLAPGTAAPPIDGLDHVEGPVALFFYKVSCPVCQMVAPMVAAAGGAYPGRFVGIGEDPQPKLDAFAGEHGLPFGSVPDLPPYPASDAYGLDTVPTLFVVDADGTIVETVESWDRDGYNRASRTLARLAGVDYQEVSNDGDGMPPFRPG
jgi:thiol-disulfide isomerase/thioredoxin